MIFYCPECNYELDTNVKFEYNCVCGFIKIKPVRLSSYSNIVFYFKNFNLRYIWFNSYDSNTYSEFATIHIKGYPKGILEIMPLNKSKQILENKIQKYLLLS